MKTEQEDTTKWNKQTLFTQRDSLAESIRIRDKEIEELRDEFEKSIESKKKHLNELRGLIEEVRSKLCRLGVPIEDC